MAAERYTSGINRIGRNGNDRKRRGSKGSSWLVVFDVLVWIAMVALTALTIICTITPHIDPARLGALSLVALGAPIIFILDIVVMLWWIIRRRWRTVLLSIISVVLVLVSLSKYYKIDPTRNPATPYVEKRFIKAISYNVANGTAEGIVDYVREKNPDILCLQEFLIDVNREWLKLGDKYRSTISGATDFSCEIITRHQILRHGDIDSISRYTANWADIYIKKSEKTVRVINIHLQSTALRTADTQFIEGHEYILDTARTSRISSIAERLLQNNIKRAEQARRIKRFIDTSPYPVIVCGDFNDVPLSYPYNHIAEGLQDCFREQGEGYTYTFNGFFRLLRIDHMLVSKDMEVVSYEVDNKAEYSDHYPVICRLKHRDNY